MNPPRRGPPHSRARLKNQAWFLWRVLLSSTSSSETSCAPPPLSAASRQGETPSRCHAARLHSVASASGVIVATLEALRPASAPHPPGLACHCSPPDPPARPSPRAACRG